MGFRASSSRVNHNRILILSLASFLDILPRNAMNNKINSILSNNDNNNNSNNNNDNNNNDSTNKNINKNKKDFFINKKSNTKEFDCKKSILGKYFSSGWTVSKTLQNLN